MIIKLSAHEMQQAGLVGYSRAMLKFVRDGGTSHPSRRDGEMGGRAFINNMIFGAIGEYAVSKALNLFWPLDISNGFKGGDIGRGLVEVRMRRPDNGLDLGIWPEDSNYRPFVLAHDYLPGHVDLRGWIYAARVRRIGVWNAACRCHFAKEAQLEPIDTLLDEIRGRRALIAESQDAGRAAE